MHCCRPRPSPIRIVISMAWVLGALVGPGSLAPALAVLAAPAPGIGAWLSEPLPQDPPTEHGGKLALHYHPYALDRDLTLALRGLVDNDRLRDHRHLDTTARSERFELGTALFDDAPSERGDGGDVGNWQRGDDGIALGARVSEAPWAWLRARRQWQIPVDGEPARVSDGLSFELGPLASLEIETGTTGDGERRSWFAELGFRIDLDGG
jgi:hypothetical protein